MLATILKMRTIFFLLLIIFLLHPIYVSSQMNNTFLTYELEIVNDVATFQSPDQNIEFYNYIEAAPGFILTHQISNYFFIESGLYLYVPTGFDMITLSSDSTNLMYLMEEFHVPFRVRFQKSYLNERVNPFFTIGTTLSLNSGTDNYFELYSVNRESDIINRSNVYSQKRMMLELGLGIDFRLSKNFILGIRYRYNYSLKEQIHLEAITQNNRTNELAHYKLIVPGHNQSYSLSASYRISSFWNKKVK